MAKVKKINPVAKNAWQFNRCRVFKTAKTYTRKAKHKKSQVV